MNRKWLLAIILVLTSIAIILLTILNYNSKYNDKKVSDTKWNNIIKNKTLSTNIQLESLIFNDYELLIDNKNNAIYYSIIDSNNKYNPSINYKTNIKANIAISNNNLQDNNTKILIYTKEEYRIYNLSITNYPTINITYDNINNKTKIPIYIEIFDNYVNSPQRLIKSDGKLIIIEEDNKYTFSLIKESLGHNKRENHISILGMDKENEYVLNKVTTTENNTKYVELFINNEYKGLYSIKGTIEKGERNIERNKEINK